VLYATTSALHHPCVFVVYPPFQSITLFIMHFHNSPRPPSNLFVTTIMESLNTFINMEAKLNGLYATSVSSKYHRSNCHGLGNATSSKYHLSYTHDLLKRQEVQNFVHPYANRLENVNSSKYHSSLLRSLKMQRVQNINYPHIHTSSTCKS
jgi:hypothetical protein